MRRGFWFAAGAGAGIYAALRAQRAAEAFTPDGLRDRWQALGVGARLLREEVAAGKAEAEPRLRERFAPTYDPTPQLTGGLDTPSLVPLDTATRPSRPLGASPRDGYSTNDTQEGKQ